MRAFLLSFNDSVVPRATLLQGLDAMSEVLNWYAPLQGAVFVISDVTAQDLAQVVHAKYPLLFFVVTELVRGYNDGSLPKAAWDFINEPQSVSAMPPTQAQLWPAPLKRVPLKRLPKQP